MKNAHIRKKGEEYLEKPGLPYAIRDKIMPIFNKLLVIELLEKCLHGKIQIIMKDSIHLFGEGYLSMYMQEHLH